MDEITPEIIEALKGDDWIYCPNCTSCGVEGCCPQWCQVCKDVHENPVPEQERPVTEGGAVMIR